MIEFVTFLLGLVAGPRTVEVSVSEEEGLADGFRAYLASVAGGGGSHPELLAACLGCARPELAAGFHAYLARQRARLVP